MENRISAQTFETPRKPSLWRVMVILTIPTILVFILISIFLMAHQAMELREGVDISTVINDYISYFVALNLSITFCVLLWFLRKDQLRLSDIGFCLPDGGVAGVFKEVLLAVISTIVVIAFLIFILPQCFGVTLENTGVAKAELILGPNFFLAFFTSVLVAAFVEESVFRGYAMTALGQHWGIVTAIIVSSLFFGIYHISYGLVGVFRTMFQGLVFALLFARSRSLLGPITAHSLTNLVGTLMNFGVLFSDLTELA